MPSVACSSSRRSEVIAVYSDTQIYDCLVACSCSISPNSTLVSLAFSYGSSQSRALQAARARAQRRHRVGQGALVHLEIAPRGPECSGHLEVEHDRPVKLLLEPAACLGAVSGRRAEAEALPEAHHVSGRADQQETQPLCRRSADPSPHVAAAHRTRQQLAIAAVPVRRAPRIGTPTVAIGHAAVEARAPALAVGGGTTGRRTHPERDGAHDGGLVAAVDVGAVPVCHAGLQHCGDSAGRVHHRVHHKVVLAAALRSRYNASAAAVRDSASAATMPGRMSRAAAARPAPPQTSVMRSRPPGQPPSRRGTGRETPARKPSGGGRESKGVRTRRARSAYRRGGPAAGRPGAVSPVAEVAALPRCVPAARVDIVRPGEVAQAGGASRATVCLPARPAVGYSIRFSRRPCRVRPTRLPARHRLPICRGKGSVPDCIGHAPFGHAEASQHPRSVGRVSAPRHQADPERVDRVRSPGAGHLHTEHCPTSGIDAQAPLLLVIAHLFHALFLRTHAAHIHDLRVRTRLARFRQVRTLPAPAHPSLDIPTHPRAAPHSRAEPTL
eukprot:scaffold3256_cov114-Isochrysis_galbana.AAC.20